MFFLANRINEITKEERMNNRKEQFTKIITKTKSWTNKQIYSKKFVMSFLIASTVVGGTVVSQSFDAGVEKKEEVIMTVEPSYNYFDVSLDNEKKDGLLLEAKAEIVAKQKLEEQRLKEEAEAKAKAEAEAKAKAEAEAKAKAEAEAKAKAEAERIAKEKAKREAEERAKQGFYNSNIPLSKDVQSYLYKKVKERGLDLSETLAVIKAESNFNPNARSSSSYGLFQINGVNHDMLARKLGTANKPYDPYVNIDWGTYMLADLYKTYQAKGLSGQELREVVLSSYNKGIGGYQKSGKAYSYINKINSAQSQMRNFVK
jgi:soluble lytic murein transglycosylase-like protein